MKGFARYPPARALSLAEGLEIAAGARLLPNQGKSDNSAINTIKRHKGDLSTMGFSISYAPLWQTLKDRGLKKIDLVRLNINNTREGYTFQPEKNRRLSHQAF